MPGKTNCHSQQQSGGPTDEKTLLRRCIKPGRRNRSGKRPSQPCRAASPHTADRQEHVSKKFAMGFRCCSESGCTLAGDLRMETTVTADQELPKTWRRPLWAPITTQTITNDGTTKTGHFLMHRINGTSSRINTNNFLAAYQEIKRRTACCRNGQQSKPCGSWAVF